MSLTREIAAALRQEGSNPTANKDFHGIKDQNPPMKPDQNKFASKKRNKGKFYGEEKLTPGLRKWGAEYKKALQYDNEPQAEEIKGKIDAEAQRLGIDPRVVYGETHARDYQREYNPRPEDQWVIKTHSSNRTDPAQNSVTLMNVETNEHVTLTGEDPKVDALLDQMFMGKIDENAFIRKIVPIIQRPSPEEDEINAQLAGEDLASLMSPFGEDTDILEEPGDGSSASEKAKQRKDLAPISEMNPALYGYNNGGEDDVDELDGWDCPSCGGPVEPMGSLGPTEHGRCRNCGSDVSRPGGGSSFEETHQSPVSIPMRLADKLLKVEGVQMDEPEDGHYYGAHKSGNVAADRNPDFRRKNSSKFYGEHDQMMANFPADDGEEGGDGEGEATTDATSSLPAMSKNGMPSTQGGVSDQSQRLGPGGNLCQANSGTGGEFSEGQKESRRPILGRVCDLLREKGEKFPSKAKEFGGKGEGEATVDKKGDKLKCESDPIPADFDAFLAQEGVDEAQLPDPPSEININARQKKQRGGARRRRAQNQRDKDLPPAPGPNPNSIV